MRTITAVLILASMLVAGCSKAQPLIEVSASLTTLFQNAMLITGTLITRPP